MQPERNIKGETRSVADTFTRSYYEPFEVRPIESKDKIGNTEEDAGDDELEYHLESKTIAFLEKLNSLLDYNLLKFELTCFKIIYIAVIFILLCIIAYHRYISAYIEDGKPLSYRDFTIDVFENIREETVQGTSKRSFTLANDFTRKTMGENDYLKYLLLKKKFSDDSTVMKSLQTYRENKIVKYLQDLALVEINYLFSEDHDCVICFLLYWMICGLFVHHMRKRIFIAYLREQVTKLIKIENKIEFCEQGYEWTIDSCLKKLTLYKYEKSKDEDDLADKPASKSKSLEEVASSSRCCEVELKKCKSEGGSVHSEPLKLNSSDLKSAGSGQVSKSFTVVGYLKSFVNRLTAKKPKKMIELTSVPEESSEKHTDNQVAITEHQAADSSVLVDQSVNLN